MSLESLEPRTLLTAAFTNDSLAGSWGYAGTANGGTIDFDDAGNIVGGSLDNVGGGTTVPGGTYFLGVDGTLTLTSPAALTGAMNGRQDAAAVSSTAAGSLALLTALGAGFTDADLTGTFALFANGPTGATTGSGSIRFDGAGNIKSGDGFKTTAGTMPIKSGTYVVGDSGAVTATIVFGRGSNTTTQTYVGTLSSGGDLVSLSPTNLVAGETRVLVAVKAGGTYSVAGLAGTWTLSAGGFAGSFITNATGQITGGLIETAGGTSTASGSYTVSSSGRLTLNLTLTNGATVETRALRGTLGATQGVGALQRSPSTQAGLESADSLTLVTFSGNRAPTVSQVKSFKTALAAVPFDITFAELLANSNAADLDGDAITFEITSIPANNEILINGLAAAVGDAIVPGDVVTWTGPIQKGGTRRAFSVRAFDGADTSSASVAVKVQTILRGDVALRVIKKSAREDQAGTSGGQAKILVRRHHGLRSEPMTVNYTITGTAANNGSDFTPILSGTVVIPANERDVYLTIDALDDAIPEGTETVIITLANNALEEYLIRPGYTKATVQILDNNRAPTLSTSAPVATTTVNLPVNVTYADFITATGATDPDGDPITIKITSVLAGSTLTINGGAVVPGTTVFAAGDFLTWTPPTDRFGTFSAFGVSVTDGGIVVGPATLKIRVDLVI